eukprot:gene2835-3869_t
MGRARRQRTCHRAEDGDELRLRQFLRRAWSRPRHGMVEQTADCRSQGILGRARLRLLGGMTPHRRSTAASHAVRWLALLCLCAAYLQGGLVKLLDFSGAIAEMQHFGLKPEMPLAVATIALELGASLLILTGIYRWVGALSLAGFTLVATFLANRFWEMAPPERFMTANSFFEHIGLIGGFLLVAWHDLIGRAAKATP